MELLLGEMAAGREQVLAEPFGNIPPQEEGA